MTYSVYNKGIGAPQVQLGGIALDTSPRAEPGSLVTAVDSWWGAAEFMYARAAGSIRAFGLCSILPVFDSTLNSFRFDVTEVANTANLGLSLAVSQATMTSGQYGWFLLSGLTPVNCTASVAAGATFGIVAAGQGGANSAGKQVLNARVAATASTTVVKTNCSADSNSLTLRVPSNDGWFVGAYLSGTGIAAGATVVGMDASGRTVTMSAVTTAQVAGNVTATYNNGTVFYNVAHMNRPFAQGAIT